jgi:hypothetical protein
MLQSDCYYEDGSPKMCRHCGHTEFKDITRDFIDFGVPGGGPPTEIEYKCAACDQPVAYWAYGSFDPAYRIGDR